jgi:hypothetical protein
MKTNVGSYDGAVRFVVGCVILVLGGHFLSWWGLIGFIPILTAVFGFCPAYLSFHFSTTACD